MTTPTAAKQRNEAAELLERFLNIPVRPEARAEYRRLIDAALATERRAMEREYEQRIETLRTTADRATARADAEYDRGRLEAVDRIRERMHTDWRVDAEAGAELDQWDAFLNEEAAR